MGAIAELINTAPTTTGNTCTYAQLLDTLDDTDRDILENVSQRRAAALLRLSGRPIGATAIGDHRRHYCTCAS